MHEPATPLPGPFHAAAPAAPWAWVRADPRASDGTPGTAKFCKAAVREVSSRGICLVLSWRPDPEELVYVTLSAPSSANAAPRPARVHHTRPSARGGWVTVCKFVA